jgi:hypothetical protein
MLAPPQQARKRDQRFHFPSIRLKAGFARLWQCS